MPNYFPPPTKYPQVIDTDRTLYLVYNTAEAVITEGIASGREDIPVISISGDWGENGFANIGGELFYYDGVERDYSGKVVKFIRCLRGVSGSTPVYQPSGTAVRGYVVSHHHNKSVEATIRTERFIGVFESEDQSTLDWRIRNLKETPVIVDDYSCPQVDFTVIVLEDDPLTGVLIKYDIAITGKYNSFVLNFGDGNSTKSVVSGTYQYPPNALNIDPVIIVSNQQCEVVQSPVTRTETEIPDTTSLNDQVINLPVLTCPTLDDINIPSITIPSIDIVIPPIITPNIDIEGLLMAISFGSISLPSFIAFGPVDIPSFIEFGPVDIPSFIEFSDVPPIGPIEFGEVPPIGPIEFGDIPSFDTIGFDTPPTFPDIGFDTPPTFPDVGFDTPPTFPDIGFDTPPTFPDIGFDTPPTFPDIGFDSPPVITVNWGAVPTIPIYVAVTCGCCSSTSSSSSSSNSCPGSALSVSIDSDGTSGPAPYGVAFSATPSGGVGPYTYLWDFNDAPSSTAQNPSHTFNTPGMYSVHCTVTDSCGNEATSTGIVITVTSPFADFQLHEPMSFDNNGFNESNNILDIEPVLLGIPSVIDVKFPEIPDLRVTHDIPKEIIMVAPSEIPLIYKGPEEIRLAPPLEPIAVKIEPITLPIELIGTPNQMQLIAPDSFPSLDININVTGIPDFIRVDMPESIRLDAPESIKLDVPESIKMQLVAPTEPMEVKLSMESHKRILDKIKSDIKCFALIPCEELENAAKEM